MRPSKSVKFKGSDEEQRTAPQFRSGADHRRAWKSSEDLPLDPQEVARLAYGLWEERGRTHGRDVEDWVEAERILRTRQPSYATY